VYNTSGVTWKELVEGKSPGRPSAYMKYRESSRPTAYAKSKIMLGSARSAFELIIDNEMLSYIRECTNLEANEVQNKPEWNNFKQIYCRSLQFY
jgi:hypothetical protein